MEPRGEDDLDFFMNGGYLEAAKDTLAAASAKLGPDDMPWEVHDEAMAPDFLLVCPCGNTIEQDGTCPNGHESPLKGGAL